MNIISANRCEDVSFVPDFQVLYFGQTCEVLDYFASLGLHCDPHHNPADFLSKQFGYKTRKQFFLFCCKVTSLHMKYIVKKTVAYQILPTQRQNHKFRAARTAHKCFSVSGWVYYLCFCCPLFKQTCFAPWLMYHLWLLVPLGTDVNTIV